MTMLKKGIDIFLKISDIVSFINIGLFIFSLIKLILAGKLSSIMCYVVLFSWAVSFIAAIIRINMMITKLKGHSTKENN